MMGETAKNSPCEECQEGSEEQLHAELEHLRQHLSERDSHIVALEAEYYKSTSKAKDLKEQVTTWREKYERLYDSHKRVQKLNQVLEDKLLQMVDKMKSEKSQSTKDIATLSVRLAESKHNYSMLQKENERYKNDMNLAIQLLQCKPDNFVSQKLDNLSVDTQARVSQYVMSKTSKPASSTQSKNGNEIDTFDASEYEFNISASLMTKILEDSIQDTVTKHCDTCTCNQSQSKPFCYNETYYSVATQTHSRGEMKNSLCLNCNSDMKSLNSNLSIRSVSPHNVKLINDKSIQNLTGPVYIVPHDTSFKPPTNIIPQAQEIPSTIAEVETSIDHIHNNNDSNSTNVEEIRKMDTLVSKEIIPVLDNLNQARKTSCVNMEPAIHHKLCDRTKNSVSSKKSSVQSVAHEELLKDPINYKDYKCKTEPLLSEKDNTSIRKNSLSSTGGISRTSSQAKSSKSNNKSNTQVGPGPRFCHLRMQAGSKNILLDNAQPDVPPVLYRRQSKCNENSIFGLDNFVDLEKTDNVTNETKIDNHVEETTLIDVHVDSNNKELNPTVKTSSINPILLNILSSPLQPLKTHNFSNSSENNNNNQQSGGSQQNTSEIDTLLNDLCVQEPNNHNNNALSNGPTVSHDDQIPITDDVKLFNFDRYEQTKFTNQYATQVRKIEMAQFHSIENTKISKDLPPNGEAPKLARKIDISKTSLPAVVNVYPNLTQTHLKVNENSKVFTNEQSTSSLSSDDSAALLHKQQLLRVAEWVEQNLEQQNNLNDPSEDDVSFNRSIRRDSKLSRLTETLNELALNMPHPVSKYSKSYGRETNEVWAATHNSISKLDFCNAKVNNIVKETIFPVECSGDTVTEVNSSKVEEEVDKQVKEVLMGREKEISPEELARMEYNVKKFLLSGPQWASPATPATGRSRRTSSKTETDV